MLTEGADQISMPRVEPGYDIVQRQAHLVLIEGEDALEHCSGSGVLALEPFLAGDEEPGDDPRRIGRKPLRITGDESCAHRCHCGTTEKRLACCMVAMTASVDSAPWFWFTPSA